MVFSALYPLVTMSGFGTHPQDGREEADHPGPATAPPVQDTPPIDIPSRPTSRFPITASGAHTALTQTCIPVKSSRKSARPASAPDVHAMLLGLCGHGPYTGVTTWTREYPELTGLLCRWMRPHDPNFTFTSIQVLELRRPGPRGPQQRRSIVYCCTWAPKRAATVESKIHTVTCSTP